MFNKNRKNITRSMTILTIGSFFFGIVSTIIFAAATSTPQTVEQRVVELLNTINRESAGLTPEQRIAYNISISQEIDDLQLALTSAKAALVDPQVRVNPPSTSADTSAVDETLTPDSDSSYAAGVRRICPNMTSASPVCVLKVINANYPGIFDLNSANYCSVFSSDPNSLCNVSNATKFLSARDYTTLLQYNKCTASQIVYLPYKNGSVDGRSGEFVCTTGYGNAAMTYKGKFVTPDKTGTGVQMYATANDLTCDNIINSVKLGGNMENQILWYLKKSEADIATFAPNIAAFSKMDIHLCNAYIAGPYSTFGKWFLNNGSSRSVIYDTSLLSNNFCATYAKGACSIPYNMYDEGSSIHKDQTFLGTKNIFNVNKIEFCRTKYTGSQSDLGSTLAQLWDDGQEAKGIKYGSSKCSGTVFQSIKSQCAGNNQFYLDMVYIPYTDTSKGGEYACLGKGIISKGSTTVQLSSFDAIFNPPTPVDTHQWTTRTNGTTRLDCRKLGDAERVPAYHTIKNNLDSTIEMCFKNKTEPDHMYIPRLNRFYAPVGDEQLIINTVTNDIITKDSKTNNAWLRDKNYQCFSHDGTTGDVKSLLDQSVAVSKGTNSLLKSKNVNWHYCYDANPRTGLPKVILYSPEINNTCAYTHGSHASFLADGCLQGRESGTSEINTY